MCSNALIFLLLRHSHTDVCVYIYTQDIHYKCTHFHIQTCTHVRVCEIEEVPGQAAQELSVGNGRSRHVATGDCWEAKIAGMLLGFRGFDAL